MMLNFVYCRLESFTRKLARMTKPWILIEKDMRTGEVYNIYLCYYIFFYPEANLFLCLFSLSLCSCGAVPSGVSSRGCETRGGLGRLPGFPEAAGRRYQSLYRGWVSRANMESRQKTLLSRLQISHFVITII